MLILLQVADEFRVRELVESAFVQATSPAKSAPVLDIPQSTAIMAQLVVKTAAPDLPQPNVSLSAPPSTVPAVSPESITDPASIAGLKARLAALQVWACPLQCVVLAHALLQAARIAASAKLTASVSNSTSPAAPSEASSPPPSIDSAVIPRGAVDRSIDLSHSETRASPAHVAGGALQGTGAAEIAASDRPSHVAAHSAAAAPEPDDDDDADADASTVVIEDDCKASVGCSSSASGEFSDASSSSSGHSSDEDDDSLSSEEEQSCAAADARPSDSEFVQAAGAYECSEVSGFMGTSPAGFGGDITHAPPASWMARLSEAPPVKHVTAQSQSEDDRLHAVNIVNVRLGILQPVLAHYDIACSAILSIMRREWHLDAYTRALQHFHLMEDGAFGDSFATALFDAMDEMSLQRMLPDQFVQLLAHALKSSQSDCHPLAHKLRLRYAPFSGRGDQSDASSDGLDRLQLELDIADEPAAIILTKEVMQCYQNVFVLLLRLRRIIRVASRLFWDMPKERGGFRDPQSLEYTKTSGQDASSMRELTLFRHEISHFAHTLQSYLMTQILHISVPELAAQQAGVKDLQQLIAVHTSFIEVRAIFFAVAVL
jgi:hypothetical protein